MGVLDTLDDHFDLVDQDRVVYQCMYQQYQQYHHHDNGNNDAAGAEAEADYVAALPVAASNDT